MRIKGFIMEEQVGGSKGVQIKSVLVDKNIHDYYCKEFEQIFKWMTKNLESGLEFEKDFSLWAKEWFFLRLFNLVLNRLNNNFSNLIELSKIKNNSYYAHGNFNSGIDLIMDFVELSHNKNVFTVNQEEIEKIVNDVTLPFRMIIGLFHEDKSVVRAIVQKLQKNSELPSTINENLLSATSSNRKKQIFMSKIHDAINSIGPENINLTKVANELKIKRSTFMDKLKVYGISYDGKRKIFFNIPSKNEI